MQVPVVVALACLTALAPPEVPRPRVALIYSDYGNFRHRDDYDARMGELGWTMDKYENTRFAELAARLETYDIVIGSALFNYANEQDFSAHWSAIEGFLRRGGVLVLTDVNYDQHVRWLPRALGRDFAVAVERCTAAGRLAELSPDAGALTSVPRRWRPRAIWAHMRPGPGWRVLARCADRGAVWALAGVGRGFVWLSSFWPLSQESLLDLWDYARFRRAGVELLSAEGLADLRPGPCRATVKLRPIGADVRGKLTWQLIAPDDRALETSATISAERGRRTTVVLGVDIVSRGEYRCWLSLERDGRVAAWTSPVAVTVPPLVEADVLLPPRRAIYLSAKPRELRFGLSVHPFGQRLDDVTLKLLVVNNGRVAARREVPDLGAAARRGELSVPLGQLEPGALRVHMAAERSGGRRVWSRSWQVTVVEDHTPQVALGAYGQTYVNGQPFFPIGIYHIKPKYYDRARRMGFNCVQVWGTSVQGARGALEQAWAHSLMAIVEMSTLLRRKYQPETVRAIVRACRDHPALLAWYSVDEPGPGQYEWCADAYEILRREDPNHPVYLVMCDPRRFARFARTTDILAIDPYPIPHRSVDLVASWMKIAREATGGGQPVWLVPQLHNPRAYRDPSKGRAPRPDELWCMVVQGLVYGAKGIVYYPWDDGPCGLTHEPALMAEIPRINDFLARYGPELAGCEPQIVADGDGGGGLPRGLHAAVFSGQRRLLLLTNTSHEAVSAELVVGAAAARSLMDGRQLAVSDGRVAVNLAPLAVDLVELAGP